jgi:hypothetical protein
VVTVGSIAIVKERATGREDEVDGGDIDLSVQKKMSNSNNKHSSQK